MISEETVLALFGEVLKNQICIMGVIRSPRLINTNLANNLGIRAAETYKQIDNVTKRLLVIKEDKLITIAMAEADGDSQKAAKSLGIPETELRHKITERTKRDEG